MKKNSVLIIPLNTDDNIRIIYVNQTKKANRATNSIEGEEIVINIVSANVKNISSIY